MSHRRKRIRDAVVTALTGLASTSDRVFPGRARPLQTDELPALKIYTVSEQSRDATHDVRQFRDVMVLIDGYVGATDPVDDDLDALAVEIEPAMEADTTFGGLALGSELLETMLGMDGDGETTMGFIRLRYRVRYTTPAGDPES